MNGPRWWGPFQTISRAPAQTFFRFFWSFCQSPIRIATVARRLPACRHVRAIFLFSLLLILAPAGEGTRGTSIICSPCRHCMHFHKFAFYLGEKRTEPICGLRIYQICRGLGAVHINDRENFQETTLSLV